MSYKRMIKRILYILLIIMFSFLCHESMTYATSYKDVNISGRVNDEDGHNISNVQAELIESGTSKLSTDIQNGQYSMEADMISSDMTYDVKLTYPTDQYYTCTKMEQRIEKYKKNTSREILRIQIIAESTEEMSKFARKFDTLDGIELTYYQMWSEGGTNIEESIRQMGTYIGSTKADNVILYFGNMNEEEKKHIDTRKNRGYPRIDIFEVSSTQEAIDTLLSNTNKAGEKFITVNRTQINNISCSNFYLYSIGKNIEWDSKINIDIVLVKEDIDGEIYPDPPPDKDTSDFVPIDSEDFVQLEIDIAGNSENTEVRIYDATTNQLVNKNGEDYRWNFHNGTYQLYASHFDVGEYYVEFLYNGQEYQAENLLDYATEERYEGGDTSKTNSRSWVNEKYQKITKLEEDQLNNDTDNFNRTVIAKTDTFKIEDEEVDVYDSNGNKTGTKWQRKNNKFYAKLSLQPREEFKLKVEKKINHIKVVLADGTLEYDGEFKPSIGDQQIITMDDEYIHGATVYVEYKIDITNVGSIDCKNATIVDYVDHYYKGLIYDSKISNTQNTTNADYSWKIVENKNDLKSKLSDEEYNEIKEDQCIIQTDAGEIKVGDGPKSIYLVTSQMITAECHAAYQNEIKVIQYENKEGRRNGPRNAYENVGYNNILEADSELVTILPPFGNSERKRNLVKIEEKLFDKETRIQKRKELE